MFAIIYWLELDVRKTSHALKCKEKIGLKVEFGNCGWTKVFLIFVYPVGTSIHFKNINEQHLQYYFLDNV